MSHEDEVRADVPAFFYKFDETHEGYVKTWVGVELTQDNAWWDESEAGSRYIAPINDPENPEITHGVEITGVETGGEPYLDLQIPPPEGQSTLTIRMFVSIGEEDELYVDSNQAVAVLLQGDLGWIDVEIDWLEHDNWYYQYVDFSLDKYSSVETVIRIAKVTVTPVPGSVPLWALDSAEGNQRKTGIYTGIVQFDQGSIAPSGEGNSVILGLPYDNPDEPEPLKDGYVDFTQYASAYPDIRAWEMAAVLPDVVYDQWLAQFTFGGVGFGVVQVGVVANYTETGSIVVATGYSADFARSFMLAAPAPPVGDPFLFALEHDTAAETISLYVNGEPSPGFTVNDQGTETVITPSPMPWGADESMPGVPVRIPIGNAGIQVSTFSGYSTALGPARMKERYEAWARSEMSIAIGVSHATAALEPFLHDISYGKSGVARSWSNAQVAFQTTGAVYLAGSAESRSSALATSWERTIERQATATPEVLVEVNTGLSVAPMDMVMTILDDEHDRTPTSLPVVISNGIPGSTINFYISDDPDALIYSAVLDGAGGSPTISVPVEPRPAGDYLLRAVSGDREAYDDFTILYKPTAPKSVGKDADPVEVPGALNPDGSRNWVLQDLGPGGLGSWVMPRNPAGMDRALVMRELAAHRASNPFGQHHIFEGANPSFEWTFTATCFTQAEQEKLYAYFELNRRIYIIDHRNRAWVSAIVGVELIPRLKSLVGITGRSQSEYTDWVAEYTVTAIAYEDEYRIPIPLEDA